MSVPRERDGHPLTHFWVGDGVPPRFSPRDWIDPPTAFAEPDGGTWRTPDTADEVVELMVAHYLCQACITVFEELERRQMTRADFGRALGLDKIQTRRLRRKLTGEYPAQLEDIFLWAAVLDRPDMLYAPGDLATMLPPRVSTDEAVAHLPAMPSRLH
jgi:hypothetical protein